MGGGAAQLCARHPRRHVQRGTTRTMGCGGSKKSTYVLQVRPKRESLTQNMSRFGLEEEAAGVGTADASSNRARRRSRRGSQKRLAQAAVASHGRITARAGSFGHASNLRATNWRASNFDMEKVGWGRSLRARACEAWCATDSARELDTRARPGIRRPCHA